MHGEMNDECVPDGYWCPPIGGAQLSSRGARAPPCPPLAPPLVYATYTKLGYKYKLSKGGAAIQGRRLFDWGILFEVMNLITAPLHQRYNLDL